MFDMIWYDMIDDMIYLLTAIGLTPGGSSTVHIYAYEGWKQITSYTWPDLCEFQCLRGS